MPTAGCACAVGATLLNVGISPSRFGSRPTLPAFDITIAETQTVFDAALDARMPPGADCRHGSDE